MNGHSITGIGIVLTTLGLWAGGCSETQDAASRVERTIAVNAVTVAAADERVERVFSGSLEGEKQAVLYAKLAEAVQAVHVREGQAVKENQVVVSLDKDGPSARYHETNSIYKNAEKNVAKMKNLFEAGAISESQYDASMTEYDVAKANFEATSRMVDVRSPIAGVVTSIDVNPGDFVTVGEPLAVIATPGRLRVKFAVNADNIRFISKDGEVRIVSENVPDTSTGRIISVAESADPDTRSFQAEALLNNEGSAFRPGMFVRILVTEQRLPGVLAVPREAVLPLDNQMVVFVVVDGIARRRSVQLGPELEGRVVITDGLQAGDTVITLGQSYLADGFKVTVSEVAEG